MNPKDQILRKQPHGEQKKQARRRRKTCLPYKDKLLNTAQARREIVAALRFHRASMEVMEQQRQKQDQQASHPQLYSCFETEARMKSRRNPRIYPGCSYDCFYDLDNLSNFSDVSSHPVPIAVPPPVVENLNVQVELPVQTLGLNLNFHHFVSMDTAVLYDEESRSRSITFDEERGLIDKDVAEIRSGREKIQETKEIQEEVDRKAVEIDDDGHHTFDEVIEFPDWLNLNDNCLLQHLNYQCSEINFHDPELSCMDLGKIEDVDGEWFA